jgi:hypothetical protein
MPSSKKLSVKLRSKHDCKGDEGHRPDSHQPRSGSQVAILACCHSRYRLVPFVAPLRARMETLFTPYRSLALSACCDKNRYWFFFVSSNRRHSV